MADGNITVEVSIQAAQAELERLRAENARLAREAHTWWTALAGATAEIEQWRRSAERCVTRSEARAAAGFTRRPSLKAIEMRAALELIATPQRPDGTWNRDREACRELAAEALGRYDDSKTPNVVLSGARTGLDGA